MPVHTQKQPVKILSPSDRLGCIGVKLLCTGTRSRTGGPYCNENLLSSTSSLSSSKLPFLDASLSGLAPRLPGCPSQLQPYDLYETAGSGGALEKSHTCRTDLSVVPNRSFPIETGSSSLSIGGGDRHVRNGCCWFISPRFFSGTGRNPADSKKPTFIDIFPPYSISSTGDLDEWCIEIFLEWVRNLSRDRDDFEIRYRWERLGPGELGTRDVAIRRSARKGARA